MSSFGQCAGPAPEQRGWGGGAQAKFFLNLGVKTEKKFFIPNYALWIRAACLLFGYNSRSVGHVRCLAWRHGIVWCKSEMVRIIKNASACCAVSANLVRMLHRNASSVHRILKRGARKFRKFEKN